MSNNFSINSGNKSEQIKYDELKGISKNEVKDEKMLSIFNALNTDGNQELSKAEVEILKSQLAQAANEDGDASTLTKKETKNLLQKLGLDVKVEDFFNFISQLKISSAKFTREEKADGSYTDTDNETGSKLNYDKNDKLTGGVKYDNINRTGLEFTVEYNDDGTSKRTYNNGEVVFYDKNEREIGGDDGYRTWEIKYNEDGSNTQTYDNGNTFTYDNAGRLTSGKSKREGEFTVKYNEDGSSVRTLSDGTIYYYDVDGNCTGGKLADGTEI